MRSSQACGGSPQPHPATSKGLSPGAGLSFAPIPTRPWASPTVSLTPLCLQQTEAGGRSRRCSCPAAGWAFLFPQHSFCFLRCLNSTQVLALAPRIMQSANICRPQLLDCCSCIYWNMDVDLISISPPLHRTVQSKNRRAKARMLHSAMSGPLHQRSSDDERGDDDEEGDDELDDSDPEVCRASLMCGLPTVLGSSGEALLQHLQSVRLGSFHTAGLL